MNFKSILKVFPPPKFLDVPFAGLSISDSAVRCIQFSKKSGRFKIEKFAEKLLPPGVVTGGQINNQAELVNILQQLKKELKLEYVKVSISEEKAYLFTAKIPVVGEKEITSAIESKIEENIPVSPAELIFDYRIFIHKEKGHLDVVVYAMPISVVQTYVETLTSAGLIIQSLEIESQEIARSLIGKKNQETVLIVNFGPEKVGLYVANKRVVRFTSTIPMKGGIEKNEEALLQELKKLYVYWHALKENLDEPENKIENIIICGEGFSDEISSYLSTHLNTRVSSGNVWTNVFDINEEVPAISFNDSLRYPAAIGLAIANYILV
jgi:hypothetical protein